MKLAALRLMVPTVREGFIKYSVPETPKPYLRHEYIRGA